MLWGAKEFYRMGERLSHTAVTSITDWPQAVCDSDLGCAFITPAPPDPLCTAALPLLYYFFLPDCKATHSFDGMSQPSDLQLQAGTQALFIPKGWHMQLPSFSAPQGALLPSGPSDSSSSQQPALPSSPCRLWFKFWGWLLGCASELQGRAVGQWCVQGWVAALGSDKPKGDTKVPSVVSPDQSSAPNSCSDGYSKRQKYSVSK